MLAKRIAQLGCASIMIVNAACSSDKAGAAADAAATSDANDVIDAALPDSAGDDADAATKDDASDTDAADASTCGLTTAVQSTACSKCLETKCCAESTACIGDDKCRALDDCSNACIATNGGDAGSIGACAQGCNAVAPADTRLAWRAYNDCLTFRCVNSGAGPCQ